MVSDLICIWYFIYKLYYCWLFGVTTYVKGMYVVYELIIKESWGIDSSSLHCKPKTPVVLPYTGV